MIRAVLREPLFHFLLIGAGLFVLFGRIGQREPRTDRIVLTRGELEQLVGGWERTWQREPTEQELAGLVDDWVREQVYAREAVAMGLDEDDIVIRRRLRQKIEFLVDDLADAAPPTEDELAEYLADHPERFREPVRVSFRQVFVSPDRRGAEARPFAQGLLRELRAGAAPEDAGDRISLPPALEDAGQPEVARHFGDDFAEAVCALEPGAWEGPVESGYGLHLVRLSHREEPAPPRLEDVREEVARELEYARREAAAEEFYAAIRARYEVVLEDDLPGVTAAGEPR